MSQALRNNCTPVRTDPDGIRQSVYSNFYLPAVLALNQAELPFLVGGAYAFERFTGIERTLKDFDIFVRPADCERTLDHLSQIGYQTEILFPHWLAKATCGRHYIDIIFKFGNGIGSVDDEWFRHAIGDEFLGAPIKLCPIEETIWSKAFVMERERYDGADVAHLLLACGGELNWPRLFRRFGPHWRLLLSHLILFSFIYPGERLPVPDWLIDDMLQKLRDERTAPAHPIPVCQGTLLSREQYLVDLGRGYQDARLIPMGNMTETETELWTAAIGKDK